MHIDRRALLAGLAAAACARGGAASAADGRIIMATWGGGTARMWRDVFVGPFEKETGISSIVAEVPDPAAAVAAAQGRPQHNVIIAASYQAANLAQRGLLEELTEADIPQVRQTPEAYWLRSDDGKLLGMPISLTYYGIAFNTKTAKASDFESWSALGDPRWKGKISITRPLFLGPYDLTLFAKIAGGDENNLAPGLPMLERLARNASSVYTSMASLQQQLALGEVVAAPFYASQVQLLRQAGQTDIDITLPKEGGLALPYVLAIPKNAPDKATALRFINACISRDKQVEAAKQGYLPLTTDPAVSADVEKQLGLSMESVRARTYSPNWYTVAKNLNERIRTAERVVDAAK